MQLNLKSYRKKTWALPLLLTVRPSISVAKNVCLVYRKVDFHQNEKESSVQNVFFIFLFSRERGGGGGGEEKEQHTKTYLLRRTSQPSFVKMIQAEMHTEKSPSDLSKPDCVYMIEENDDHIQTALQYPRPI